MPKLIYRSAFFTAYYAREVEISRSGKTIDLTCWKRGVTQFTWGVWSKELGAEAARLNKLRKELDEAEKAFDERLEATQAAAIAEAKAAPLKPKAVITTCQAQGDGDCEHKQCPQLRDGEPKKSGRHCPLDKGPLAL